MKTVFSIFFFFVSIFSSQLLAQSNIVVGGGEMKNTSVSMSYVIGQDIYSLLSTYTSTTGGNTGGGSGGSGGSGSGGGGETPVGIDEIPYDGTNINVLLYPNPTDGIFYLEFKNLDKFDKWSYKIVDLIGYPIQKNMVTEKKTTVDVNDLVPGTYLLIVMNNNSTKKVIKFIRK